MKLTQPELPYALDALAPHMSRETLEYHYGKHHKTYVDKTNALIGGTEFANAALEDIVRGATGPLYNNAAQAWNHGFFWNCLTPRAAPPGKAVGEALKQAFGSLEEFQSQFTRAAVEQFGSGWAWLVREGAEGGLRIVATSNADTPLRKGLQPLLTCDVWEHAYYIDYRNDRPTFLRHFWSLVNWAFVERNLDRSPG